MSEHIENAGAKGACIGKFFIGLLLFICLWAYMYYSNMDGLS